MGSLNTVVLFSQIYILVASLYSKQLIQKKKYSSVSTVQPVIVKLSAYPLPSKKSYLFTDTVLKNVYPSSWWESIDLTNEHIDMWVKVRAHLTTSCWKTPDCSQLRTLGQQVANYFHKHHGRLFGRNFVDDCPLFWFAAVSAVCK